MDQNHPPKPLFIVFDGMDGTGKTTQMHRLAAYLKDRGIPVTTTAEPTALPSGTRLREALSGRVPVTNAQIAAMFLLDRICHNTDPASGIGRYLADGITVLCDRYYYSSLAYQGGDDPDTARWVADMNLNCPAIRHPDGCILFDMDPAVSMARIRAGRPADKLEVYETVEQQKRIRARYHRVCASLPADELVLTVDASGTLDEVTEQVIRAYEQIAAHAPA